VSIQIQPFTRRVVQQQELQTPPHKLRIWPIVKKTLIEAYWMGIIALTLLAWGYVLLTMMSDLPIHHKAGSVILFSFLPLGLTWYLIDQKLKPEPPRLTSL